MYRKVSAVVIPTLIAAAIIAWMLFNVWDQFIDALRHMVPAYLAGAIIICLIAWVLRGWRYRSILKSLGYTVSVLVSTACIFVSQTVNLIVLARIGDLVRVFILKHEDRDDKHCDKAPRPPDNTGGNLAKEPGTVLNSTQDQAHGSRDERPGQNSADMTGDNRKAFSDRHAFSLELCVHAADQADIKENDDKVTDQIEYKQQDDAGERVRG